MSLRWLVLLVLALGACDPASAPTDGGGDAPSTPIAPAPAAAAMPPDLGPCPTGFTARPIAEDGSLSVCDPWPTGEPIDCGPGEAHFVGEPGCVPIGTPCPDASSDGFPVDLPTDGTPIVYVRAGATGGDGTRAAPFGTVPEAVGAARGGILAVAPGDYDGEFSLFDTTLWGACASGVTIRDSTPAFGSGVVTIARGASTLRNVRITGGGHGVLCGPGSVTLEDVAIEGVGGDGVRSIRATDVVVRRSVIRDTSNRGVGVRVQEATHVELERVAIERTIGAGLTVLAVPDVVVRRASIRGIRVDPMTFVGSALTFAEGAIADVRESFLHGIDLVIMERQAGLSLHDVTLRSPDDGESTVNVSDATEITFERVDVDGHVGFGIGMRSTTDTPFPVVLRDVVVRRGRSIGTFTPGFGIELDGVETTIERVAVLESSHVGIRALGGTFAATDLRVDGVVWDPMVGTMATGGAVLLQVPTATLRRVEVGNADVYGLVTSDAVVDVRDVRVHDLHGVEDPATALYGGGGMAVALTRSAGSIAQVEITGAVQIGLVSTPTSAPITIEDVTVTGVAGSVPNGFLGWGLGIYRGSAEGPLADPVVRRVRISGARDAGIYVGVDIHTRLEDVLVEGTLAAECGALGTCTFPNGSGLGLVGATVDLVRVELRNGALAGMMLESGPVLTGSGVRIVGNRVGIAYWETTIDPSFLSALVLEDNDTDQALAQPWSPMPPP